MRALATTLFFVAGLINFIPITGFLSADRLEALYGLSFEDANLLVLMRHRAVLLGIVGGIMLVAAFHHPLRRVAIAAGMLSMLTFIFLAHSLDGNAELRRVALVDVVAILALLGGALVSHVEGRRASG